MNGKPAWTGIAPSPRVFDQLDHEEASVLALLAWCVATNRPVTSSDVAALPDRHGQPLGISEVRDIVRRLSDLKIASVLGVNNDRPMSIFLGGFQPASARRSGGFAPRSAPGRPMSDRPARPSVPGARTTFRSATERGARSAPKKLPVHPSQSKAPRNEPDKWGISRGRRVESTLAATEYTPDFVMEEAIKLRARLLSIEADAGKQDPVKAAKARLRVLQDRIDLYERWLKAEPRHPTLLDFIKKKRRAVSDLEFQIERIRAKKAEAEAEKAAERAAKG